jgi:hypothetical protein
MRIYNYYEHYHNDLGIALLQKVLLIIFIRFMTDQIKYAFEGILMSIQRQEPNMEAV